MSKFSNLLRLLILLKSKKRMKTKELADVLGVSERMIRKYITDLSEANINIESIPGPAGGYELVGYDYLLNLDVEKEEVIALKLATKQIKESENFKLIKQLESLNDKMSIISSYQDDVEDYSLNSVLKVNPNNFQKDMTMELELQAACVTKNKIRINYNSISSGDTTRIIRPYGLVSRNNLKYLIAHCEQRNKTLTFKLIRINNLEVLAEKFLVPEEFDIKWFMRNQIGLFNDDEIKIKLKINKPFSYSVSEGSYSNNQKISWNEDESIIFEGNIRGKTDIIRWILSMRTYVTVIEPEELKEELKIELRNMLETI